MKPTTTSPPDVDLVDDPAVDALADDALPRIHQVVDDPPSDEPVPSATWLAAYAMGLVASHRPSGGVDELLTNVHGAAVPIRAALRHLEDPTVGDARLRAGARALLEAAIVAHDERLEPDPS